MFFWSTQMCRIWNNCQVWKNIPWDFAGFRCLICCPSWCHSYCKAKKTTGIDIKNPPVCLHCVIGGRNGNQSACLVITFVLLTSSPTLQSLTEMDEAIPVGAAAARVASGEPRLSYRSSGKGTETHWPLYRFTCEILNYKSGLMDRHFSRTLEGIPFLYTPPPHTHTHVRAYKIKRRVCPSTSSDMSSFALTLYRAFISHRRGTSACVRHSNRSPACRVSKEKLCFSPLHAVCVCV